MKLIKLNCAACGAPISIPDNLEQLSCSNCGTHLMVEHGQGYYALKSAEQISDAINQSGRGTQDAIREGAQQLYQRAASKQHQLDEHLLRLRQQVGDPPESP
jgi:transcription elongation factor Elf1